VVTLAALTPGFWRANLVVSDPVGDTTSAPELLFLNDGATTLATDAQSDTTLATTSFRVELAVRIPGGLPAVTSFAATLDAPNFGLFSLNALALGLPLTLHGNLATNETLSLELTLPAGLPSGPYDFHVLASDGASSSTSTVTVSMP